MNFFFRTPLKAIAFFQSMSVYCVACILFSVQSACIVRIVQSETKVWSEQNEGIVSIVQSEGTVSSI